jgi:thioredoxin reductase (NADPH)
MNADPRNHFELVIIGAGPAGLAAALYAAREGTKTLVLEKAVVGGMAAITNIIDNYPGFDSGVGGLELADHLYEHAVRFGAEVRTGVTVTGLKPGPVVETDAGPIPAGAVLITTGSTYKQLGLPGESDLIGRGVHFCATCDAPLYRGKDIVVVGGGNSAIQESLFIARFAKHLTLLVRGTELKGTEVLREQLGDLHNVSYRFQTVVEGLRTDGQKLTGLHTRNTRTGEELDFRTDAVFIFIGLKANTEPFAKSLKLDEQGFIYTDKQFATNLPGVYAAGDVRSGSTWQIASAVGEGVSAALEIREHLTHQRHQARKAAKTSKLAAKPAAKATRTKSRSKA